MFTVHPLGSLLIFCLFSSLLWSQQSPKDKPAFTTEQKEKLKERDKWGEETTKLRKEGKFKEALVAAEKMLKLEREVLGNDHEDVVGSLQQIAQMQEQLQLFEAALQTCQDILEIQTRRWGKENWRVTDAKFALSDVQANTKRTPEQRQQLQKASSWNEQVVRLWQNGKSKEALSLAEQALKIRQTILGENHPSYAISLNNLALVYKALGSYDKAEPLYVQAKELRKKLLGENHPSYAISLNNLAMLYQEMGNYAQAELLYLESKELRKKLLGENHPSYAISLNNLAMLYKAIGDYPKAEVLYVQAREIRKHSLGENHPDYASSLNNLASIYQAMGSYDKAEKLYRQAQELTKKLMRENHPDYASNLNNLAGLYQAMGSYDKAEELFLQAKELRKKLLGENHPDYATSLNNLALLYKEMESYAQAEPLYVQAQERRRKLLGENHPDYAISLHNLAGLYYSMGIYDKAEGLYLQSVQKMTEQLDRTAVGQTEVAQINYAQATRGYLNNLLIGTAQSTSPAVYEAVFRLRGLVTVRQRFARTVRQAKPELQPTIQKLQSLSQELSNLVNNPPRNVQVSKRMAELIEQREQVERELAQQSEAFASFQKRKQQTVADLQKLLPDDTVIIDFLQYYNKLTAFVLSKDKITRIELGEMKPIAEAVAGFRKTLDRTQPLLGSKSDPALVLKEKLWQPLTGAIGQAKLVLICPDRELCQFPFAALPGNNPEKYLIEEISLAVLPSPQQLFDLFAPRPQKKDTPPSLLVVGNVDFNADLSRVAVEDTGFKRKRAGELQNWLELSATKDEMVLIANLFQKAVKNGTLTELQKDKASEPALRNQLGKHEFVHLATHGFFAPQELTNRLEPKSERRGRMEDILLHTVGLHSGLLSGIVLAGANKPHGEDDGVLTALEVENLDLSYVELAVLSACETGLGAVAGGEGVLGLQRAFQLAGARTTVTSLWKVDDKATRDLMTRFYTNYFQKNLGTLESLREAQLAMLKDASLRGKGKKLDTKIETAKNQERTSPFYWAAFVLSGDWR